MYWNSMISMWSPMWFRLIETWDVLKSFFCTPRSSLRQINRNMRCIEIHWRPWCRTAIAINRNMRCIEILVDILQDVLRSRLIETWDVLKLVNCNIYAVPCWINRNMRCIEILQYFEVSYLNKKQYFKILHQRLYGISKI